MHLLSTLLTLSDQAQIAGHIVAKARPEGTGVACAALWQFAGAIFPMASLAERLSRAAKLEKERRRARSAPVIVAETAVDILNALSRRASHGTPVPQDGLCVAHFPLDPAERRRRREARMAAQRAEAERVAVALAVQTAADDLLAPIRVASNSCRKVESGEFDTFAHASVPPVNAQGRLFAIRKMTDGSFAYEYERRTRIIAGTARVELRAFVRVLRAHPEAAPGRAAAAREAFAKALADARARDRAMMGGAT